MDEAPASEEPAPSEPDRRDPDTPDPERPDPERPDPDSRPATAGDLRGLRRWLLVSVVWAIAATAIAVIALVVANRAADEEESARGEP